MNSLTSHFFEAGHLTPQGEKIISGLLANNVSSYSEWQEAEKDPAHNGVSLFAMDPSMVELEKDGRITGLVDILASVSKPLATGKGYRDQSVTWVADFEITPSMDVRFI